MPTSTSIKTPTSNDFKKVNQNIVVPKITLSKMKAVFKKIPPGSNMIKVDLRHGYWNLPLQENGRHHCAFRFQSKMMQYRVLPQGLSISPYIFQTYTSNLMSEWYHTLQVTGTVYLDDLIICNKDKKELLRQRDAILKDFKQRRFQMNISKSVLEPTKRIEFLGMIIDSDQRRLMIPPYKR